VTLNQHEALTAVGGIAFRDSPCLMTVIDPEMRLVLVNDQFSELFGPGRGEPCHRIYKGKESPCGGCFVRQVFRDGEARYAEEEGITPEGDEIRYRARAVPLRDENGDVVLVLHMAQDLTRLLELEAGLDEAERLAAVGLTMAGMAHTIKNILGGLEGGFYLVDSGLEKGDGARVEGGWEMVKTYVEQVATLVKNLLRYARAEDPVREAASPADLLAEVETLYAAKAELVGVELAVEAAESLPRLMVDREGIGASLANLVSNALDACVWDPDSPDKVSRVTLAARPADGGGVTFEVRDNGMGISPENQARILTAFFTTKGIRGTGLGLLLTRKTVEAHGGRITFDSTVGVGSSFRFNLPAALVHQARQGAQHEE